MHVQSTQSVFMFKSFAFRIFIVALVLRLIPVLAARGLGIGLDDMFQYDMLARSLAKSLDCTFNRIQFTSDLLPGDLTGSVIAGATVDLESTSGGAKR